MTQRRRPDTSAWLRLKRCGLRSAASIDLSISATMYSRLEQSSSSYGISVCEAEFGRQATAIRGRLRRKHEVQTPQAAPLCVQKGSKAVHTRRLRCNVMREQRSYSIGQRGRPAARRPSMRRTRPTSVASARLSAPPRGKFCHLLNFSCTPRSCKWQARGSQNVRASKQRSCGAAQTSAGRRQRRRQ